MPTHQSLSGASDDDLRQRMVKSHPERFGEAYWKFFDTQVAPHLPSAPTMIDLGCGPGLFLRDLGQRYPAATLHGYDVTPAMIAHGRQLAPTGATTSFTLHDAATQPLPLAAGTVHLVSMSSVLHVIDDPRAVLAEIRRVLAPGGIFLLNDWVRQPLETYLAWRRNTLGESEAESQRRGFRLFPVHSKYTADDWRWLLEKAGFTIRHETELRASHRIFVTTERQRSIEHVQTAPEGVCHG
jgi:ubiquinone/menaquinone biosynthesis C-methylase UbiE